VHHVEGVDPDMTYRSPLLDTDGAVEAGGPDAGIAAHYGQPLAEQKQLAAGAAVVDLSQRGVVTVAGPDRLSWLNTLSSQALTDLAPGVSSETLLLSIQGRIEFAPRVIDDGTTTWLIVEADEAAGLTDWLTKMKFALRVEVADVSADWGVIASTAELPGLAGKTVWQDPWPRPGEGGYAYSATDEASHPGYERPWFEYLVPADELKSAVSKQQLAGVWAAEALRIAAWRPRFGVDTDEKTIPHELDLIRTAVHLSKGCYKGQETIARVHNLGHPPRRLVFLQLDGSQHTIPAPGSGVIAGERTVGKITSVAQHYEMGPIALAMIKRNADPEAELIVDDDGEQYPAVQELIVATDAGQVVGRQKGFLRTPR
jgi:tRNA-modifying protein YgfZ